MAYDLPLSADGTMIGGSAPSSPGGADPYAGLRTASTAMMVFGAVSSAVGAYYSIQSNKYQAKSQALNLEFERTQSYRNARASENEAQLLLEAGQREAGRVSLQYGQAKAAQTVRSAAGGIAGGVGSSAEVAASSEYAKEADLLQLTANSVRAASAARTRGVNFSTEGLMAGVSAQNLRGMAKNMNPWIAGATSMIGSAGQVGSQWVASQDRAAYRRGGA